MSEPRFEIQPGRISPSMCKGCGRGVFWVKTINDRPMILDSPAYTDDLEGRRWVESSQTHWSSCPERQRFVKPKKAAAS